MNPELLDILRDMARQGMRGLGESGAATLRGVGSLIPGQGPLDEFAANTTRQVREHWAEPETGLGTAAQLVTRLGGDIGQFAMPGGLLAKGGAALKGARAGLVLDRGMDAVAEAGDDQGGTAGLLSDLAGGEETGAGSALAQLAATPVGRAGVGVVTGSAIGHMLESAMNARRARLKQEPGLRQRIKEAERDPRNRREFEFADPAPVARDIQRELRGEYGSDFAEAVREAQFYGEIDPDWDYAMGLPDYLKSSPEVLAGIPDHMVAEFPEADQMLIREAFEDLNRELNPDLELLEASPRPVNTLAELRQGRSSISPFDYDSEVESAIALSTLPGTGRGPLAHPGPEIPSVVPEWMQRGGEGRVGRPLTVFESPTGTKFSVIDIDGTESMIRIYDDDLEPLTDVRAALGTETLIPTPTPTGFDEAVPKAPVLQTDLYNPVTGSVRDESLKGAVGSARVRGAGTDVLRAMAPKAAAIGPEAMPQYFSGNRVTGVSDLHKGRSPDRMVPTDREIQTLLEEAQFLDEPREFATILRQLLMLGVPAGAAGAALANRAGEGEGGV